MQGFYEQHFAGFDRQIVLVDVLGAIHQGPRAVEDLRRTMAEVLSAFRPGRNGWLSGLLGGKRVEKILFAATKADHIHSSSHDRLDALLNRLVANASRRARFAGARTRSLALASLRATREGTISERGEALPVIIGGDLPQTLGGTLTGLSRLVVEKPASVLTLSSDVALTDSLLLIAGDLDLGVGGQQHADVLARQRLVVDDQHLQRRRAGGNGTVNC